MQINYLDAISSVLNMMKQPDSACKNIDMQNLLYLHSSSTLMDKGIPFSMDAALDWLEIRKREISMRRSQYARNVPVSPRSTLLFGDIKSSFCRSETVFSAGAEYRILFRLTPELEEYWRPHRIPLTAYDSVAVKESSNFTSLGVTEPEAITIDTLIEYWNTYCKSCKSLARRQNAVCAMTALMKISSPQR